jgi:hypothetical protein
VRELTHETHFTKRARKQRRGAAGPALSDTFSRCLMRDANIEHAITIYTADRISASRTQKTSSTSVFLRIVDLQERTKLNRNLNPTKGRERNAKHGCKEWWAGRDFRTI